MMKKSIKSIILCVSILLANLIAVTGQNSTNYGTNAGNSGQENCNFGYNAGNIVTGDFNNSIGAFSGYWLTSGNYNTFSGYRVGLSTTTGTWNTFVGSKSGTLNTTGGTNVFIGGNAGYSNSTSSHNVYVGYGAGYNNTGSSNVFIGYNAGSSASGSNKLYISNSSSNILIYGDFSEKKIGIGTTTVTNGQLQIKPSSADANHGITLNMEAGSTARSYLKSDGSGDYNWFMTRGGADNKGITISKLGYVGIGRTSPSDYLDVQGNILNGGADFILGKYDGRTQGSLTGNRALVHSTSDELVINYNGDFEGGVRIMGSYNNKINGSLSIGNASLPSGFKLSADGAIIAEEVQVDLSENWPDFIFNDDHDLMKLNDLEEFIKTHHHLPDVPSAEQIENEGQKLGEMNTILLRKIEELTLYIIELKKENEFLLNKFEKSN